MGTKTGQRGRYICKVGHYDIYAKDNLRPKKDDKDKKVKYGISIDRYLFDKMKNEEISVSKFIKNLVKEYYERKEKM